jgi:hypothetical protein
MKVHLHSHDEPALNGVDPVLTEIYQRLQTHPEQWLQSLKDDPASFGDLEKTVHHAFQQMADQLVAGLLAQATQADDFAATAKKK